MCELRGRRFAPSPLTVGLLFVLMPGGCPFPRGAYRTADLELVFNLDAGPTPVETVGQPVFASAPLFDRIPGKIGSHGPSLTAFPDGELLAAWYSYEGPHELNGSTIYTARLGGGAERWDPPQVHLDRSLGEGNPVLYSEGDAVWMFSAVALQTWWSTARIEVQRSLDRGHTWTDPVPIDGPFGSNLRFPPVRLRDGTLLLPAYDDLFQQSLFFSSEDGQTWSLRSAVWTEVGHQNLQPSITELDSGRVLAVMRNSGTGWLWVSASDDGGWSWAPPRDGGFANPGAPAQLLKLASGNLLLVFNNSNEIRGVLSVTISADDGITWLPPKVLVEGGREHIYPAAAQTPDGLIHILYSHARERIEHITLNEAWLARVD